MIFDSLMRVAFAALIFMSASFYVYAQDNVSQTSDARENADAPTVPDEEVFFMEDYEVLEKVEKFTDVGRTDIPREFIENLPRGNGGVTDILQYAPGVQFDEAYRGSTKAGEIAPADISISGGKTYENLFLIDGMNNSNLLNPGVSDPYSPSDVPGHAQKFFIDSWLIEDITLYDSNIPAAYDGFTGGVVDVVTRRPRQKFGGNLSYRTTRSEWTHYFINDADAEQLANSTGSSEQPRFRKNFYSASFNIPIIDNSTGILLSYNLSESSIPQIFFNGWKDQTRQSQTFLLKASHNIDGLSYIDASVSYSPHEAQYFLENTMDSDFTITGGGYFAAMNYTRESGGGGHVKFHADWSYSENSRNSPADYKTWIATPHKPWGGTILVNDNISPSKEGGWGSIDQEDESVKLTFDQRLEAASFLGRHKINYGTVYNNVRGRYHRLTDAVSYNEAVLSYDVRCNIFEGTDCISGEQYFRRRTISPESDVDVEVNLYAAYLEDSWDFSRFNLRMGGRMSLDDYMNNYNISPRLQLQYDIFGNRNTVITAGYSRYYSSSPLSNKLQEGKLPSYVEKRRKEFFEATDWETSSAGIKTAYNYRELNTPYSNEYMIGVNQDIFGSNLGLKYIERYNRDEIAQDRSVTELDGIVHYRLNNNGRSNFRSAQLSLSRSWEKKHTVMLNASWQEAQTSNSNYNNTVDLEELEDIVIFEGRKTHRYELPKDNFNRPIRVNLAYTGRFFDHFTFSAIMNYRTPYRQLQIVDSNYILGYGETDPVTGETVQIVTDVYEIKQLNDSFTMDCSFAWEQKLFFEHQLVFTLEVSNILNTRNEAGRGTSGSSQYELGRQFWAGLNYKF
jgi:hypothetical protein